MQGTVKWFNSRKGFGFITPSEGEKDMFVHYSSISTEGDEFANLNENDEVEFDAVEGQKGMEAKNVKVTKKAPYTPRPPRGDSRGDSRGGFRGGSRNNSRNDYY